MKKKLSIFVIVAALLICMIPFVSAEGEPALTVTPNATTAKAGDSITVTVAIANNPGHASGEVLMSATEGLTLTALEAVAADPDADDYPAFELNPATGLVSWSCSSQITGDVALFTATYTVATDAEPGTYTITASPREAYSFRGEYDPADATSGEIITVLSGSATVTVEEPATAVNVTKHAGSTEIDYAIEGQVVTVTHTAPCKVGYWDDAQDKYVAIPAVASGDSYTFTAPEGVTDVILVVKGDATGDGRVNAGDCARIKAVLLGTYTEMTAEARFSADATGEGSLNAGDCARIKASTLGSTSIAW